MFRGFFVSGSGLRILLLAANNSFYPESPLYPIQTFPFSHCYMLALVFNYYHFLTMFYNCPG